MPRSGTIFIVEDDDEDYELMRVAFEKSGSAARLLRARDGEELLASLAAHSQAPAGAVILLDLRLLGTSGFDVLARLKREAKSRAVPVLVLTTSANEADVARAYELGACSYFQKPASFSALREFCALIEQYWFRSALLP